MSVSELAVAEYGETWTKRKQENMEMLRTWNMHKSFGTLD